MNLPLNDDSLREVAQGVLGELRDDPNHPKPSEKWAKNFRKRHPDTLMYRKAQNIKRKRAEATSELIIDYHKEVTVSLEGVPPLNRLNYDETPYP